ncbi:MAG: MaoC family dehydratase [Actinophytocola sp.]|uniref:MaoC family dehydratase N-terminal domain-containing protein n=1 Tax=Actinophytocola sp. TaxID=1872138 RepID=UPI0013228FB2|nr:MaoC family dehydratase N-terminal domain-containing protein [Actinophytocola sp.]MPZ85488.1 MaoC family dehydratase [Actinophytocola sp.]
MPLDPSYVGHAYPRSEIYEVGREKVREFADAIGDPHPMYRDVDAAKSAGHPDVIAPPTFVMVLFNKYALEAVVRDPGLGLDYDRMVHGDMTFTYTRPVQAGDQLVVTTYIDDIMARAGNDFLTLRAEIDTVDGDQVITARAQLVVRGS